MEGIEPLADAYDSVDEILAASQEELIADNGIGDRRATKILHRHTSKPQDRIRETSGKRTIAAVEDDEGVLRLPEELEDETE
jgi:NAD-dependent DNA ligase